MNKPVSYKLAKLLKEKGIIFETEIYYSSVTKVTSVSYTEIAAPTIAEVVMWLYEKRNMWIEVRHIKTFNVNRFHVIIWDYKDTSDYMTIHCDNGVGYEVWNTPTEAYEAAIEYTLNNLI